MFIYFLFPYIFIIYMLIIKHVYNVVIKFSPRTKYIYISNCQNKFVWLENDRNYVDQVPNLEPGTWKIFEPGTETGTKKSKILGTRYLTRNQEQNQELKAFIPGLTRKLLVLPRINWLRPGSYWVVQRSYWLGKICYWFKITWFFFRFFKSFRGWGSGGLPQSVPIKFPTYSMNL